MINLDDVEGRSGSWSAPPRRPRRRDDHRVSPRRPALRPIRVRVVWAAAAGSNCTELHTARDGRAGIRGVGDKTAARRSSRATKAFYRRCRLCDLVFSASRASSPPHLAIVEFELAWAPHVLSTMTTPTGAPRRGFYPVQDGMPRATFFRRNVVLSFQRRHRRTPARRTASTHDVGLGLSHSESTFPNRGRSLRRSWPACRTTNRPRSAAGRHRPRLNFESGEG